MLTVLKEDEENSLTKSDKVSLHTHVGLSISHATFCLADMLDNCTISLLGLRVLSLAVTTTSVTTSVYHCGLTPANVKGLIAPLYFGQLHLSMHRSGSVSSTLYLRRILSQQLLALFKRIKVNNYWAIKKIII